MNKTTVQKTYIQFFIKTNLFKKIIKKIFVNNFVDIKKYMIFAPLKENGLLCQEYVI